MLEVPSRHSLSNEGVSRGTALDEILRLMIRLGKAIERDMKHIEQARRASLVMKRYASGEHLRWLLEHPVWY